MTYRSLICNELRTLGSCETSEKSSNKWETLSHHAVRCRYCCRIYSYQYFIVLGSRSFYLFELKHIR
jgi:hypothetical protein